jgi:hypothetical protein
MITHWLRTRCARVSLRTEFTHGFPYGETRLLCVTKQLHDITHGVAQSRTSLGAGATTCALTLRMRNAPELPSREASP